jgi:hypothetical protein
MKVLLGMGVAGCIYAFYNDVDLIISENIGGMNRFPLNAFIFVDDVPENRDLLDDVELPYYSRTIRFKYLFEGQVFDYVVNEKCAEIFMRKKLEWNGVSLVSKGESFEIGVKDGCARILETNLNELTARLVDKILRKDVSAIQASVKRIDVEKKLVYFNDESVEYDCLISTIPANVFWRLSGRPREDIKTLPATYAVTDLGPKENLDFDILVDACEDHPYHRVRKLGNLYVYEFTGFIPASQIPIKRVRMIAYQAYTRFSVVENVPPPDVQFLGRFASLNPKEKIQHVVTRAKAKSYKIGV